ncbi:hypothetical protein MGYG_03030 [Nannizzia gypsea CBS 118893]|uniref:Arf-GAP domain-containing protein n=1 Tax=Arthroderma gypseum (strain ATCC MYA-4604 / CBS 118893) TaxID=535722 RepID=E4UQF4_ARTGP|nr:hypothetical protein MGYG_03030 [Nannizzia gypsea CBS 118893]EFR00024.1 hypothetical protein MGYG_03030 [Nannizzia gypsea CBS 118893]
MSALSKRQQARNERTLQDLITSVPGNDRCADCQARNPGWGSWNLGIFLCMRCATLHRKLGTHISKVKSLTMDSWTAEQVETMKRNGNIAVNKIYNPRNIKPSIPVDIDEVDSVMERFVRKKYELKTLEDGKPKPPSRQDPSYTTKPTVDPPASSPTSPPYAPAALPSKPKSRFGFGLRSLSSSHSSTPSSSSRSATGTLPSLRRRESLETSHVHSVPLPNNKQSRTLGVSIADRNGSLESKLEILRDMGFMDERRNMTVLKGLNGDVERCIDTLTRLGEKTSTGPRSPTSPTGTQSGYRTSSGSTDIFTPPSTSSNPFDKLPTSHHNTMPALSPSYMFPQPQQQQQQQPAYSLQQQPAMPVYQQFQQQQPQQPQQPNRIDKSSILALYNFSQPPPTIPEQPQQQQQAQQQAQQQPQLPHLQTNNPISTNPYQNATNASPMVQSAPATTTGTYANHNPFFTPTNAASSQPATTFIPTAPTQSQGPVAPASNNMGFTRTHISQESIDIRQAHSGRHSPDIFASLSARY